MSKKKNCYIVASTDRMAVETAMWCLEHNYNPTFVYQDAKQCVDDAITKRIPAVIAYSILHTGMHQWLDILDTARAAGIDIHAIHLSDEGVHDNE